MILTLITFKTFIIMEVTIDIQAFRSQKDYTIAIARLENICDAPLGTPEAEEAETLATLIEMYEEQHFPIGLPHPIEAIKIRMEELGLTKKDLIQIIGYDSRVSEILSGKRKLSLEMIRRLHKSLSLPLEVLVQNY
jgi:HTH-type transcriptional regulator / antitoxin HigA